MRMTKLNQYIKEKYDNSNEWFMEFVNEYHNQARVLEVERLKNYLNGDHAILQRQGFKHNGKEYHAKKIVLNYAKTILSFQKSYLLQTPITLIGNEKVVSEYKKVSKQGKYDRLNMKILDKVLKYGEAYEYLYMDNGMIKSKIIGADEGYPLYNEENEMIAFVQMFVNDGISYYTVFTDDVVERYDNKGGELRLTARYANLSGLPVAYTSDNELSETEGRSELSDWVSILDNMESLLSKHTEATEVFLDPIFLSIGQQIKESLPADIVGKGIHLDDGGEAKYLQAQLDVKSFENTYKTLQSALLDISSTPAVSMGKTDISNLSEVSIRLLFSLANVKAGVNEQFMREGIEQRFDKIRTLLKYKGIEFSDDDFDTLDHVYHYAQPANDKEIIENLKVLKDMNSISTETVISKTPYIQDIAGELDKLKSEGVLNRNDNMSEDKRKDNALVK